ncbi:MAG: hypothetical protein RL186_557 [Pseudomonadota bacterium]|jgi:hypothetical protein
MNSLKQNGASALTGLWNGRADILASAALLILGTLAIWFGPTLSGYGAVQGSWCHTNLMGPMAGVADLMWAATQHCPYCYLGAAMIGAAFALPAWRLTTSRA